MTIKITILVLLAVTIFQVIGEPVVISQSFTGNKFEDADGWVVGGATAGISTCMGTKMFGGYKFFGAKAVASKLIELPPHSTINLKVNFWKIDSWENEKAFVFIDDQLVWTQNFQVNEGKAVCGSRDDWKTKVSQLDLNVRHSGPTAIVVITTNLNESADNESWGFRQFILSVEKCPEGCSACLEGDTMDQCKFWNSFLKSWSTLDAGLLKGEGWTVEGAKEESTMCGAVPLLGGYEKFGSKAVISNILKMKPHYKLKLKVLFAKIDSWDNEAIIIKVDGRVIYQRSFYSSDGYWGKICGNPVYDQKSMFARIELDVDHTGDQAKFEITTTLDEAASSESFGVRDLYVFYAGCSDNCAECTGPRDADCNRCVPNYSLVSGMCQPLTNLFLLEQSFLEDKFQSLNGWVLSGSKGEKTTNDCSGKQIVGGFDIMGVGASAKKTFTIPPHRRIKIQANVYKIDSWDGEYMFIKVDGVEVWKQQWTSQTGGSNICGQGVWPDAIIPVEQLVVHTASQAEITFTSTLDQDASEESWGFRDFRLWYEPADSCAIFCSECGFQGQTFVMCSKSPNLSRENSPSQIKSIRVPPQGRVTLYENSDYQGKRVTFTQDQPCLQGFDLSLNQLSGHVEGEWVEVQ